MQVLSTVPVMFSYWVNVTLRMKIFTIILPYYALNRSSKHRPVELDPKQRWSEVQVASFLHKINAVQ